MKSKIFELVFKFLIVAFGICGIFLPDPNGMAKQFWFFTLQTNVFVVIFAAILCVCIVLELCCNKPVAFATKKTFLTLKLMVSFFITITGVIYCFVLAPAGIIYNHPDAPNMFNLRNVLLHIVVPIMTVVDYFLFSPKIYISKKTAFAFLIYPIFYFLLVNVRVWCGGTPFYDGTMYPYFFIDPTLDNQGWGAVCLYLAVISILFYLLARLYIYLSNKVLTKQQNKKIEKM